MLKSPEIRIELGSQLESVSSSGFPFQLHNFLHNLHRRLQPVELIIIHEAVYYLKLLEGCTLTIFLSPSTELNTFPRTRVRTVSLLVSTGSAWPVRSVCPSALSAFRWRASERGRTCVMSSTVCRVCSAPAMQRCAGCQQVGYCGRDHQRADWKAQHRDQCRRFKVSFAPRPRWPEHSLRGN